MPFVEIIAPPLDEPGRQAVARGLTEGLCAAFSVGPETVTAYFLDVPASHCAHAGRLGETQRLFVKVHAFRRGPAERARAAALVTPALAAAYGVPAKALALYFLDRARDEVSHAGILASEPASEEGA